MKSKHVKLSKTSLLSYPVSSNIQANIPTILDMVEKINGEISKYKRKKDVILWCRGSSGAIIAGIMAVHIPNAIISHVKKDGESSHDSSISYRPKSNRSIINIIVDDFVSSGATLNAIYEKMETLKMKVHGVCVSGSVYTKNLKFNPDFFICGELNT